MKLRYKEGVGNTNSIDAVDSACSVHATEKHRVGERRWNESWVGGAYVHVPFCEHRCGYCNFAVTDRRHDLTPRFAAAVLVEIDRQRAARRDVDPLETLYIGGGTPTQIPEVELVDWLTALKQRLPLSPEGEWTLEANPADLSDQLCRRLVDVGVNRLSLGIQSFSDAKLSRLDRRHDAAAARRGIAIAQRHFTRVSIDLMYAAPGETMEQWRDDLRAATDTGCGHVSIYCLTIEKGTSFFAQHRDGKLTVPADGLQADMYEATIDHLAGAGLDQYEVSNFAVAGEASRHNSNYWGGRHWFGFGPSAAAFLNDTRRVNHPSLFTYLKRIEAGLDAAAEETRLTSADWTVDAVVFGLRRSAGIDWNEIGRRGDWQALERLTGYVDDLIAGGLAVRDNHRLRLTRRGLLVSDAIWPRMYQLVR